MSTADRRLKNGAKAHEFTPEERKRGAENRWAKYREQRAEAERLALERLADEVGRNIDTLVAIRDDAETTPDRRQAATYMLDHVLGRSVQRTELTGADGGPVVVENDVNADAAETILAGLEAAGLVAGRAANGDAPADEVHPARAD